MNFSIKYGIEKKKISSLGGNVLVKELNELISLRKIAGAGLPENKRRSGYDKFLGLYYGFIDGAECLDDMSILGREELFSNLVKTFNPTMYGKYLKSFDKTQTEQLRIGLCKQAVKLRSCSMGFGEEVVFDIDSTKHRQYGLKMEGVNYSYTNEPCLDSLSVYDEYGFCYWFELRPGETYSSNGSSLAINSVIKQLPYSKRRRYYIRGDSAFSNSEFYHSSYVNKLKFVCAMKSNVYNRFRVQTHNWRSSRKIYFGDGRRAEVGSYVYFPDGSPQALRIVFMRARKQNVDQYNLLPEDCYDYHAFVTNISEHEMNNEKILLFYRKRGNAENFIREMKNGFDLKHFPCQKLSANRVYGIIACYSYNTMRYLGTLISKKKIPFSKRIRFSLINLACQVIRHARYLIVKFPEQTYGEVMRLIKEMKLQTQYG